MNNNKSNILLWSLGLCAFIFIVVILGFYIFYFRMLDITKDTSVWGTFGDYFGGTLNPIISFLALIGLLYTIHQQAQEMRETRKELESAAEQQRQQVEQQSRQSEIFNQQQFESTFFALLEQHNRIIDSINVQNTIEELHRQYERIQLGIEELEFEYISNCSAKEIVNKNNELRRYFIILFQILKFVSINVPVSYAERGVDSKSEKINIAHFSSDTEESGRLIGMSRPSSQEKLYSNIIRSFVPNEILKLLLINCLSVDGFSNKEKSITFYNFQGLLNRYKFLEHLKLEDIEDVSGFNIMYNIKSNFNYVLHFFILTGGSDIAKAFGVYGINNQLIMDSVVNIIDRRVKYYEGNIKSKNESKVLYEKKINDEKIDNINSDSSLEENVQSTIEYYTGEILKADNDISKYNDNLKDLQERRERFFKLLRK